MPFYLTLILKKGYRGNFFFQVSTILSNMFTYYIQNLEIYNAFIISEPEFTVCLVPSLCEKGICFRRGIQPYFFVLSYTWRIFDHKSTAGRLEKQKYVWPTGQTPSEGLSTSQTNFWQLRHTVLCKTNVLFAILRCKTAFF